MTGNILNFKILIFLAGLGYHLNFGQSESLEQYVCPSMRISHHLFGLEKLRNCSRIEGNLEIVRIERTDSYSAFDGYSFPRLQEVTGYLVLYRVDKLRSLSQLFPNLSVIRGDTLVFNYALVLYEMQDLEEIGLSGLTKISKGGIRVEHNPRLCYLSTISWSLIVGEQEIIYMTMNRALRSCLDVCPRLSNGSNACPLVKQLSHGKNVSQPLCWNMHRCQKTCPAKCGTGGMSCYDAGGKVECCHEECLGGCGGPTRRDCSACLHFFFDSECIKECPPGTYMYKGRWCLTFEECINGEHWHDKGKILNGECFKECPPGFNSSPNQTYLCQKCLHHCPKVCRSLRIESLASAQKLKGCTIINGSLEIQIRGGNQIAHHLEENLGLIEEITGYLRVFQAHSLISLRFLKSLKVVHGKQLFYDKYAISLIDNQNLKDIWDFDGHDRLTVGGRGLTVGGGGLLQMQLNRKLCLHVVERFVTSTGRNFSEIDDTDISRTTNGDLIPCEMMSINLKVSLVSSNQVLLEWNNVVFPDLRQLLGYMIYYRAVTDGENVTVYSRKDACESDIWKFDRVMADGIKANGIIMNYISHLEPFTNYAVYVETYTITSAKSGAISPLTFFKTLPSAPSVPRDVKITSSHPSTLSITWSPPFKQNGIVTHYYVLWHKVSIDASKFDEADYCHERKMPFIRFEQTVSETENGSLWTEKNCCQCQANPVSDEEKENAERKHQIDFQNYLQNMFYHKVTAEPKRRKRHSNYDYAHSQPTNTQISGRGEDDGLQWMAIVYNQTELLITNLLHYQEYDIEVIACQDPVGREKKLCSLRTLANGITLKNETADDLDMRSISHKIRSTNGTELILTWLQPVSPNGIVLFYEVELDRADHEEQKRSFCITRRKYISHHGYVIRGLTSGDWSYKIRATSLTGNGSWSKPVYVDIPQLAGEGSNLALNVGAPLVCVVLSTCLSAVLVYLYVQKRKLKAGQYRISNNPNYLLTEDVYEPDEWEVDRSQVTCLKELGSGSFGKVFEGIARNLDKMPPVMRVAVKTTLPTATTGDIINFLREASRMKIFENGCNHVVKLYGVVSKGRPPYVIMELMSNGDLRELLRSCRTDSLGDDGRAPPSSHQMLRMAAEIADGMAFLESKGYIHRDLASRNCLVSEEMVVKIADFGMTRDIYITDYYRKEGRGMLPVRWMPKESLEDGYFDHKSDVWSYGVVLWEVVTLGHQPYMGLSNEQVCEFVLNGGCPNLPEGCHPVMAKLMADCWIRDPKQRISFGEILQILKSHVSQNFMEVSFYFINQKKPCQSSSPKVEIDEISPNIHLRDMHSSESACSDLQKIKKTTTFSDDQTSFNYRNLPMPVHLSASRHHREPPLKSETYLQGNTAESQPKELLIDVRQFEGPENPPTYVNANLKNSSKNDDAMVDHDKKVKTSLNGFAYHDLVRHCQPVS